jgi:hypothetical protein
MHTSGFQNDYSIIPGSVSTPAEKRTGRISLLILCLLRGTVTS